MERTPCVYILASKRNGTLYTGVTSDLPKRVWQHKQGQGSEFTSKHKVHALVWFEVQDTMETAITREKLIKEWKRTWKLDLIETSNPEWIDLYDEVCR